VLLILASSCGVKGNPVAPSGSDLPSVLENYPDVQVDSTLKETKKK
jgi:hypothetical protein